MAISTINTTLKWGSHPSSGSTTYDKSVDIIDFPNMGGAPEQIDITTLSDTIRHYILGVQQTEIFQFNYNYTAADHTTVSGSGGSETALNDYMLTFSDGSSYAWQGYHIVVTNGAGVNEKVTDTMYVAPVTELEYDDGP